MTNSLVDRWNRGCDSLPLLQEADQTITQLHAAVKTAQELAARRLMEIERLQAECDRLLKRGDKAELELSSLKHYYTLAARNTPEPCEQPQYRKWPGEPPHCMSCDCGMTDEQKRTVPEADYLRVHKELMDLKYPQQAASRDTSSDLCPKCGESTDMPIGAYHRCAPRDASPADLVGALQDVVHTDPGPVRAGKAVKSGVFAEILSHHPDCSFHSTVAPATPVCDCGAGNPPLCECLVRDKEPSAYHNVKCPRYVADKL